MFYSWEGRRFLACSSVSGLLAAGVPTTPDLATLAEHLRGTYRRARGTFFSQISRVLPGHVARWTPQTAPDQKRWFIPAIADGDFSSLERAAHRFKEGLRQSVRASLDFERPAICQLSGGLDSSGIASLAGELAHREDKSLRDKLVLSTAVFPGLPCDEEVYASQTASTLPFSWKTWSGLRPDFRDLSADSTDPALPFNAGVISWAECADYRQVRGAQVILQGHGGNQIATERGYWSDLARASDYGSYLRGALHSDPGMFRLPPRTRAQAALESVQRYVGLKKVVSLEPPVWVGPLLRPLWQQPADDWLEFDERRRENDFPSEMARQVWLHVTSPSTYWELEILEQRHAQNGFEGRHPYLDVSLLSVVLAVPPALRPPRSASRSLQRYAFRTLVPSRILKRRTNTDFASADAFHGWAARDTMWQILNAGEWRLEGLVDLKETQKLWRALVGSGVQPHRGWRHLRRICGLEIWLRRVQG